METMVNVKAVAHPTVMQCCFQMAVVNATCIFHDKLNQSWYLRGDCEMLSLCMLQSNEVSGITVHQIKSGFNVLVCRRFH